MKLSLLPVPCRDALPRLRQAWGDPIQTVAYPPQSQDRTAVHPRPEGIASPKPRSRLMQRNVKPLASAIWHPMFDFDQPLLVAGMLLGLSSSLHCFGMCSGIAASLHFAADLDPRRSQTSLFATTLLINAGRIAGYVIAGAIVGGIGSGVFGAFDHSVSHAILRWAAAAALGWIGLSMLEVLPVPAPLYRMASGISHLMNAAAGAARLPPGIGLFIGGAVWGFLPCAMVYAALFYAMLSGSWLGGAVVMSGFGLGTLPVLIGAGIGLPLLRRRVTASWLRKAVGIAILMVGVASAGVTPAAFVALCRAG